MGPVAGKLLRVLCLTKKMLNSPYKITYFGLHMIGSIGLDGVKTQLVYNGASI
jgi:hypothetical protein